MDEDNDDPSKIALPAVKYWRWSIGLVVGGVAGWFFGSSLGLMVSNKTGDGNDWLLVPAVCVLVSGMVAAPVGLLWLLCLIVTTASRKWSARQ